jgi:LPXTG-motif cell wall-anchored protein
MRRVTTVLVLVLAVLLPAGPVSGQASVPGQETTTTQPVTTTTTVPTTVTTEPPFETGEPTTTTTTAPPTTTTTEDAGAAGAGVLPATGSSSAFPLAQLAIVLMAAGGLALIAMRREVPSEVTSRR